MIPPQADRVPGASLKIQSKIKQFELLHPVPITLANISTAVIVAAATIIESYFRSLRAWISTLQWFWLGIKLSLMGGIAGCWA